MSGRFFSYFPVHWLGLFLLCLLVRLPWYFSHHFTIDADEAMMGIMARDLLHGRSFPLFFYGHNYGLVTFEVIVAAVFILVFGSGIWALKLGGIFIFSLGLTFILRTAMYYKLSRPGIFFLMVCMAVFPSWILWGGMLRGGYLTAFLCMCILFYISQVKQVKANTVILSALIMAIGFQSHALLYMAILPFVCSWVLKNKKWTWSFLLVPVCLLIYFLINAISAPRASVWGRPVWVLDPESLQAGFLFITRYYFEIFAGSYYNELPFVLPLWWKILLLSAHIGLLFLWLEHWKTTKSSRLTLTECVLMLVVIFILPMLVGHYSPHFLLGYATCMFFLLVYITIKGTPAKIKTFVIRSITLIFVAGVLYLPSIPGSLHPSKGKESTYIYELVHTLQAKKKVYVFCTDHLLQWQLNYLGNDQLFVCHLKDEESSNWYADQVNKAWKNDSTACILAGVIGMYHGINEEPGFENHIQKVNEKYFIIEEVTTSYLQAGGYPFWEK